METEKNYIIATIRPWNIENFQVYFAGKQNFFLVHRKEDLTPNIVHKINPRYIFFPHWSWIIPKEIWQHFECVLFHMTNLPYGRGGSPLQNLIVRGKKTTSISALQVDGGIDTGPIYFKRFLALTGSAEEIYKKMSRIIFTKMIPFIIQNKPTPFTQKGRVVEFTRRKPEESNIKNSNSLKDLYDVIRMLDAPEYPKAFLETDKLRFEFSKVKKAAKKMVASVEIYEK